MSEEVVFKGFKDGLQLIWSQSADFSAILERLNEKLATANEFFNDETPIKVVPNGVTLTEDQCVQLSQLLAKYGLSFECEQSKQEAVQSQSVVLQSQPLVIDRTVRGGQKIVHDGNIIINSDVNPGAEVVAGGDIIVRGTCRGVVHAGAYGNDNATITADRLLASQIRIAGHIARAPDDMDNPVYKERARIEYDKVIIEPADE